MPLYEYKCHKCGKTFEIIQKFSDEPLTTHEGCGGAVERLLSAPALQFKGTGWYVTDYARKNGDTGKSSTADSGKKTESGGGDSTTASTESKSSSTESKSTETKSPGSSTAESR